MTELELMHKQLSDISIMLGRFEGQVEELRRQIEVLQKRVVELERENFTLSAGVCDFLRGDDHGNSTCVFRDRLKAHREQLSAMLGNEADIDLLLAKDAVSAKPVTPPKCPSCPEGIDRYFPPVPGCMANVKSGDTIYLACGGHNGEFKVKWGVNPPCGLNGCAVRHHDNGDITEYFNPNGTGAGHNHRVWWPSREAYEKACREHDRLREALHTEGL